MAADVLRMEGNHYAPHFGALQGAPGYGGYGFHSVNVDPYARQTQMQPHRGPPLHARQPYGFYGGHGRQHNSFKPMNAHPGPKRKFDNCGSQAPQPPLLHQLRQDNLKKARRHFQGSLEPSSPRETTPRTAPRAPDNRHGFLLSAPGSVLQSGAYDSSGVLHAVTPSAVPGGAEQLWKNSYGNADKEAVQIAAAAGLDFLGSFYDGGYGEADEVEVAVEKDSDTDERCDGRPGAREGDQPPQTFDEEASLPPHAKRKLASQAAYIAQLEEQQLTLRERIFLLEQQLAEARRPREGSPSERSVDAEEASDDDHVTSSSD